MSCPAVVQTDASVAGLGATLLQKGKPVAYISRSLTDCEKNYAPIELETLAIVYAMSKFDQYLFGHRDVTIHTDHKALIPIFKKPVFKASRRIQSMLLCLQRYAGAKVVWQPGKDQLTADLLSRDACMEPAISTPVRDHAFSVAETKFTDCPLPDSTYVALKEATLVDPDLQKVQQYVEGKWPPECAVPPPLKKYLSFQDELSVEQGVLFKGVRAIIPTQMRSDMLNRLHSSHQGIKATLRRARMTIYWPGMAEDVVKKCQECRTCLKDATKQPKEDLKSHSIPVQPWSKVGIDLFELKKEHFVIIVDYTTDYFEYIRLRSQKAVDVITGIKEVFARLGVPKMVQSDNASNFTSIEFSKFSRDWNFIHSTSSPHYPQSNGKVEAAVKIAKRILRRCTDPYLALLEYRNTPTEGMSTSPIQRIIGRPTQSMIPQNIIGSKENEANWQEKLVKRQKIQKNYNKTAKNLSPLQVGQPVMIRDYRKHKQGWKEAKVIAELSKRSYTVEVDGELRRRNRRDLRPAPVEAGYPGIESDQTQAEPRVHNPVVSEETVPPSNVEPRRSGRQRNEPAWLKDYIR